MASEHIKRSFTSFAIRKMQIKTKCHCTCIRMAKIWNTNNTKCWWGWRATVTLIHCWWECKRKHSLCKTVRLFLKTLNILCHMIWQLCSLVFTQNLCTHKNMLMNIWVALFIIAKTEKQPRCSSVDEQINCGILFDTKEKWATKLWKHMRKD